MDYLYLDNLINKGSKTERIFLEIEENYKSNKLKPSKYVDQIWSKYKAFSTSNQSLNGNMFEVLIKTALYKEGVVPFYPKAKLGFVPNIEYDIILFPKDDQGKVDAAAPICLSIKTSFRERYKQADLEGLALKNVYRKACTYLLTCDNKDEIKNLETKILNREVLGIDKVISAMTKQFDLFIDELKKNGVGEPPPIEVMESKRIVSAPHSNIKPVS